MKASVGYKIGASWGPRQETPQALARRWLKMIERLQDIDPIFEHWYVWEDEPTAMPLETDEERLAAKIARGGMREDGIPEPRYGYQYRARNTASGGWGPRNFAAQMFAGAFAGTNFINLETDYGIVPDADLITYPIFKAAVLALAESFDATRCFAYPTDLSDLWPSGRVWPTLCLSWISYVAPRFAPLVTPPPTAIVMRRPRGGLLMAATDEPFVTANPRHLAVSRDIVAAVAPFNALPWPPERYR